MKRNTSSLTGLYTIGVAALFLAGFLLLVILGANAYRSTAAGQSGNMDDRALLSYLSTTLRGNDTAGGIRIAEDDSFGTVLSAVDGSTGYALRLYLFEGQLVEDYARAEAPLQPGEGQIIGRTETFAVTRDDGGLLRIRTDAGTVLVMPRTGGAL